MGTILFAGDPHRNFSPIIRACLAAPSGDLIIVGDCDCTAPLPEIMAPAIAAGWRVHWILGNHDTETVAAYDNLAGACPEGDLGRRVSQISGVRIAGLPGLFRPRVWSPRADSVSGTVEPPSFTTRAAFLASLPPGDHWRGGLPLWHRDTIFPEDFEHLQRERFDVLVTHEAPGSHRHGFAVIDELAAAGGARLIVHGHHHESYAAVLSNGVRVRGLGIAEVWAPDCL